MVIGTPGRIKDLSLDAQALQITTAKTFVVDEADMTLEFGYLEDIEIIDRYAFQDCYFRYGYMKMAMEKLSN